MPMNWHGNTKRKKKKKRATKLFHLKKIIHSHWWCNLLFVPVKSWAVCLWLLHLIFWLTQWMATSWGWKIFAAAFQSLINFSWLLLPSLILIPPHSLSNNIALSLSNVSSLSVENWWKINCFFLFLSPSHPTIVCSLVFKELILIFDIFQFPKKNFSFILVKFCAALNVGEEGWNVNQQQLHSRMYSHNGFLSLLIEIESFYEWE